MSEKKKIRNIKPTLNRKAIRFCPLINADCRKDCTFYREKKKVSYKYPEPNYCLLESTMMYVGKYCRSKSDNYNYYK